MPRSAPSPRQGGFRRAGQDRRHRIAEFPPRRHGQDGLWLRPAARIEAGHHFGFGVGVWPIRALSRPPGVRSVGPGDERADASDRDADRPAARHRLVDRRPLHLIARDDRHAGGIASPRPHRRGPGGRCLPDGLGIDHGRDPDLVLPRDRRGRRRGRPAALPGQGRPCRDLRLGAGDGLQAAAASPPATRTRSPIPAPLPGG